MTAPRILPFFLIAVLFYSTGTVTARQSAFPELSGPYLGQKPPGRVPELFAPEIFKQRYDRYHSIIVFSPDGREAYWQASIESQPVKAAIFVSRQINGYWTEPQITPFSESDISSDCPFLSPDGQRLFFLSQRPMPEGAEVNKGENIWVMDRTVDGWSEPSPLPSVINSLSKHWQVSVDRARNLYFGVWKVDPNSRRTREHDIYCSRYQSGQYGVPVKLGPEINAPGSRQYSPYIAPDSSYLIFTRVEKTEPPVIPVVTLNISYRDKEGEWTKPVVLNDILQIKEGQWGSQATVSPDGQFMFFLKENGKDIYWVDASFIDELRPTSQIDFPRLTGPYLGQKPPGRVPEIFAPGIISFPDTKEFACTFSPDGKEFYYTSTGQEDDYASRGTTQRIMYSKIEEGRWSKPRPAEFSKGFFAHEPHVTFDNQRIYWYWALKDNPGVYFAKRTTNGWSEADFAGPGGFVSSSRDGSIYVGDPRGDFWSRVTLADGRFAQYEALPDLIKGLRPKFSRISHPCIAPDGTYVVFDVEGGHHLFVSFKNPDGPWSEPVDLTEHGFFADDGITSFSPDGKYLFFHRNNDIYWIEAGFIEAPRYGESREK